MQLSLIYFLFRNFLKKSFLDIFLINAHGFLRNSEMNLLILNISLTMIATGVMLFLESSSVTIVV